MQEKFDIVGWKFIDVTIDIKNHTIKANTKKNSRFIYVKPDDKNVSITDSTIILNKILFTITLFGKYRVVIYKLIDPA